MKFFEQQSDSPRTYVIAEVGNNHNGSMETAKKLVVGAKRAGADCVKFQMRDVETLYRSASLENGAEDLGSEYVFSLLKRFDFSFEQHQEIKNFCDTQQIDYLCTPWDEVSVDRLLTLGVFAFKVASADLTNFPLLNKLASTKLPLVLSTGMSSHNEIVSSVNLLKSLNSTFAILHCNSTYPAPFSDINLQYITELKKLHSVVGYSGHERGFAPSLGALTLGAQIIERHITFDRTLEGPDHAASLTVQEFSHFVAACRQLEDALGLEQKGDDLRVFSQGEKINRDNLGKSLVAAKRLQKGHIVKADDVLVRAPGQGLSPNRINEILGKTLDRTIEREDFFFESDLSNASTEKREFQFSRSWGIPVRYHDFLKFREMTNANKWEFHLSFNDMEKNPRTFIPENNGEEFVVHAPELFSGSHLLDLVARDRDYRRRSIDEMQRVVEITQELKLLFPNSTRPLIVANVGGFTMDEPIQAGEKPALYERLGESLAEFETKEVEIIPQTMAPFPWHFGGQRYQNLFVEPNEIIFWARQLNLRVCLDVSHSYLASNHHNFDYYEFVEKCGPLIAHIHMGDGSGVNGEGLQLGEGNIDIPRLVGLLNKCSSDASFIPEIWQGHKDNGVGFWKALLMLEGMGL